MADAVIANWDGHDYQARFFWIHASGLRDPEKPHVVEVSYEADGPKASDDVIVRYSPGNVGRRPFLVEAAHHQVKFHVNQSGRFGYADLVEPEFIGATRFSILQRLKEAVEKAPPKSTFTLVTTDRVRDDDPLGKLLNTADKSLNMDKLFDDTTDRSEMGKIRKLWREHLALQSNDELKAIVDTFHIMEGYYSLQDMRENVDLRFQVVGLLPGGNNLEFKFDGAARALKATQRNVLSREEFETFAGNRAGSNPRLRRIGRISLFARSAMARPTTLTPHRKTRCRFSVFSTPDNCKPARTGTRMSGLRWRIS